VTGSVSTFTWYLASANVYEIDAPPGVFSGNVTAGRFTGPLTGNVTGNVSGSAATVTGAAQTAITSVGTLTGLTVTTAPTFSALTAGSIPFAGTAGLISQDNANLFWDNTNKRLGIGTATIPSLLTVAGLINMKNYTVSTLPSATRGDIAYVTDALAPAFLTVLVGGGTVVTPAFYNGTAWIGF
jgi:hypothetical protein